MDKHVAPQVVTPSRDAAASERAASSASAQPKDRHGTEHYSIVACITVATAGTSAQHDGRHEGHGDGQPSADAKRAHKTEATVKKVDPKGGVVTLAHGPVPGLNWPAMTMNFRVKYKMLWSKLAEGKKIDVEFVKDGDDYRGHQGEVILTPGAAGLHPAAPRESARALRAAH